MKKVKNDVDLARAVGRSNLEEFKKIILQNKNPDSVTLDKLRSPNYDTKRIAIASMLRGASQELINKVFNKGTSNGDINRIILFIENSIRAIK